MSAPARVLVVDLGTTSLKVGLATFDGRVLWHESHDCELVMLPGGGAVQDAGRWWDVFCDSASRAVTAAGAGAGIAAVAITGQWASTVPVDADGVPVGPCLLWMDSRGGASARRRVGGPIAGYHPLRLLTWVRRTGGAPALDGADPLGHHGYLREHEPDVYGRARWLLEPVDYLAMRLTGDAAATQVSMIGSWLTDNRRLGADAYDRRLVRLAGVDLDRLPPLRPSGGVLGEVRPDVARRLGLSQGVRVVAGLGDAHASALGSGAVAPFEAHLGLGTSSWVSCHVPFKKTDVFRQVASVPSTLPGRYLVVNNHETSGRALHWLREVLAGSAGTVPAFDELTAAAAQAPPGAGGVLFTPWLAGERTPVADRKARAGFHNVSLATTRAELVRAVLEGVAFNDRWTLDAVERFVGRRLEPLRLVGGGAQSDLWCQIHADVLDRVIEQVEDPVNAGLRGAALAAAIACGAIAVDDVPALVAVRATYTPHARRRATYDRLYGEFRRLYARQRRMFARLNGVGDLAGSSGERSPHGTTPDAAAAAAPTDRSPA